MAIETLNGQIAALDDHLAALFAERMELSAELAREKTAAGAVVTDVSAERVARSRFREQAGEAVEDYELHLEGMAAHLDMLGEEMKDPEIMAKILRRLPPRFKHIAIAIKTLLDMSTMMVADLTGRLKEDEEAF